MATLISLFWIFGYDIATYAIGCDPWQVMDASGALRGTSREHQYGGGCVNASQGGVRSGRGCLNFFLKNLIKMFCRSDASDPCVQKTPRIIQVIASR